jgi:hypothetical protein
VVYDTHCRQQKHTYKGGAGEAGTKAILKKAEGDHLGLSPLRSEDSRDDQAGEAGPCYRRPKVSDLALGPTGSSSLRSDGSRDGQTVVRKIGG